MHKFSGKVSFMCYTLHHAKCTRPWCTCVHHEIERKKLQRTVLNRLDNVSETDEVPTVKLPMMRQLQQVREIIRRVNGE